MMSFQDSKHKTMEEKYNYMCYFVHFNNFNLENEKPLIKEQKVKSHIGRKYL
jgi:hypothetical protein